MNNSKEKKSKKQLYNRKIFFFIYNNVKDKSPNANFDIKEFYKR